MGGTRNTLSRMPPSSHGVLVALRWALGQVTGGLLPGDVIFSGYDCDASRNWTLNGRPYARAGLKRGPPAPDQRLPGVLRDRALRGTHWGKGVGVLVRAGAKAGPTCTTLRREGTRVLRDRVLRGTHG